MDVIAKISELLGSEDGHKRIAAAVVLGELGTKDARCVKALSAMAEEPLEPFANAALTALGKIGARQALPVMIAALRRGPETRKIATEALAAIGEEVLPQLEARLAEAEPEMRALLTQVLAQIGGKHSFALALEGLHGQPWESANRVALGLRQEIRSVSGNERRALRHQLEKFLGSAKTRTDEPALRAGIKVLGYFESADDVPVILGFLGKKQPLAVRLEAATALRFAMGAAPGTKGISALLELLSDDPLLARAARDTLMSLRYEGTRVAELGRLAAQVDHELSTFAIARLGASGGKIAEEVLGELAGGADRTRAQAAVKALAGSSNGAQLLASALIDANEEAGAHAIAEALRPLARKLDAKTLARLEAAAAKALDVSVALGRRKLEPVQEAHPDSWAKIVREAATRAGKKDPARRQALIALLAQSSVASADDRFAFALAELDRESFDAHPRARAREAALPVLERLAEESFPLAKSLERAKTVTNGALHYLGFHFAEHPRVELRGVGEELLELVVKRAGRTKLGKAAKNKLALLRRADI